MLKKALPILILALFLSPLAALGEERALTLKEAVDAAMKGNHSIRAAKSISASLSEDIGIAKSRFLPSISLEERFMRTNNPTLAFASKLNQGRFTQNDFAIESLNNPTAINDYQTSFSVEQIVLSKKASVGVSMAERQSLAGTEDLGRRKEEIVYHIIRTKLMADTAQSFVATAEKYVGDAKEHLRLAQLRYTSDVGLYSDVLRASTVLTEAEQRLTTAQKNLRLARRQTGLLLGLDEQVLITDGPADVPLKAIDYYAQSALSRKDIRSMSLKYENAKANIDLASSAYYPTIALGGAYMLNDHQSLFGNEGDSWQVSASLRWSIFDGELRKHETGKARHGAMEAAEHLTGLKKAVSYRVYETYLAVEEARKNVELASKTLQTAEEGERLVRARYENGLTPVADMLDALSSLDNARSNHVMRVNELKSSVAALHFESGTIIKDFGLE